MSTHICVRASIRQTNDKMLKMKKSLIFCMLLFCAVAASAQTNIRKGSSAFGNVLYNWDRKNLRQGSSEYGPVIANWDGENIRQGSSPYDKVIILFLRLLRLIPHHKQRKSHGDSNEYITHQLLRGHCLCEVLILILKCRNFDEV
jgi:hypothetical protein